MWREEKNITGVPNTKNFVLSGHVIQKAVSIRISRHETELESCLDSVAYILQHKAGGDLKKIASLMLSLEMKHNLVNDALVTKAHLERASFLMDEITDLSCISNNLIPNTEYGLSLEEAKRYGLL